MLVCTAAATVAAALVHRVEPHAEGSGIPRVEAVADGRVRPDRFRLLPVKYVGGLLAISSGMALGREGPSVQMGASAAVIVATVTRRNLADLRLLVAAGAAAGLATAFNAPIAGGVFVLEELVKRFDPRTTVATLVASASGFLAAHLLVESRYDFAMTADRGPANRGVRLDSGDRSRHRSARRAVQRRRHGGPAPSRRQPPAQGSPRRCYRRARRAPGLVRTDLVGSGDGLTQQALYGHGALLAVTGVLVLRFALGVVSYAAATPGGLFAPMLVLGSQAGLIVGLVAVHLTPHAVPSLPACALIGMAAFFTASVHAPVTGLILATEMTGNTNQLPPMLGACAVAMLIAVALRSAPIYDRLAERAASSAAAHLSEV